MPILAALHSLKAFFALLFLAVLAVAGYAAWYVGTPLEVNGSPLEFEIAPGSGFRSAADQLEKSGVKVRRYEFELLARGLGRERDVKAGSYWLGEPVTPLQLLDKLTRGDVTQAEVRLIEGWTFA